MFYPIDSLKKGGRFYICWVADSWPLRFATITPKQLWSQDIRKICNDIIEVVTNESGRPTHRFSLRLSSQLMRGLVRLYQRKTTVFLSDLCVLNANIMKNVNKKWHIDERTEIERRGRIIHPVLQKLPSISQMLLLEEHETAQTVEDLIRNSRNVVSNVQDITLRESTIPELLIPARDGFGEENPEQALQLVADRTMEVMLQGESLAMQHSGLELALDITSKSQDKSRLPHELQMERITEHDITMFGKEIPEIPDIPLPDLPVPQMTKLVTDEQGLAPPTEKITMHPTITTEMYPTTQIELEDLDESEIQPKRRRLKNKLIIDKRTKIHADFVRARVKDKTVELRCQNIKSDKIEIRVPCDLYFRRPCHVGRKIGSRINLSLTRLFQRNLGIINKESLAERTIEKAMARAHEIGEKSLLQAIQEVYEPTLQVVTELSRIPPDQVSEVDISKEGYVTGTELRKSVGKDGIDISNFVTQKIGSPSPPKRAHDEKETENETIKRKRLIGYVSFRESQQETIEDTEKSVQAILQDAGLADIQAYADQPLNVTERSRRLPSENSETPLGSLDRTKVSLGDSDQTTDFQRFIREQWGTEGTMIKIIKCIRAGESPVTVETLIAKGPVLSGFKKIIAARCFTSILKLKYHGLLNIKKDRDSLRIADIRPTTKFDQILES